MPREEVHYDRTRVLDNFSAIAAGARDVTYNLPRLIPRVL